MTTTRDEALHLTGLRSYIIWPGPLLSTAAKDYDNACSLLALFTCDDSGCLRSAPSGASSASPCNSYRKVRGVAQQGVDEDSNGNHDDFCRPRNSLHLLLLLEGRRQHLGAQSSCKCVMRPSAVCHQDGVRGSDDAAAPPRSGWRQTQSASHRGAGKGYFVLPFPQEVLYVHSVP